VIGHPGQGAYAGHTCGHGITLCERDRHCHPAVVFHRSTLQEPELLETLYITQQMAPEAAELALETALRTLSNATSGGSSSSTGGARPDAAIASAISGLQEASQKYGQVGWISCVAWVEHMSIEVTKQPLFTLFQNPEDARLGVWLQRAVPGVLLQLHQPGCDTCEAYSLLTSPPHTCAGPDAVQC